MPPKPSKRARVSVYKLSVGKVEDVKVKSKYLEEHGFTDKRVFVGEVEARLVIGQIRNPRTRWAANLEKLIGEPIEVSNTVAAALLLVPIDDTVYAMTYGMGHFLVDYDKVVPGFGLQYAARVLDADAIKTVTRHTMDSRAQIERRSIPSGADILAFGLMDMGSVVSRVIGKARNDDGKSISIKGADSLNLPLGRSANDLINDFKEIARVFEREITDPDLRVLTRMSPLQNNDPRREALNHYLHEALLSGDNHRLGTAWPWAQTDEFSVIDSVTLKVPGFGHQHLAWLTIDDLREALVQVGPKDAVAFLRKAKVLLHSDEEGEELASPEVSAIKWVAYEIHHNDLLFFFHDGRWFSMEERYSDEVRQQTESILSVPSEVELPPWYWTQEVGNRWDEKKYNEKVMEHDARFLVMDRKKIHSKTHRHGIEACDLLGPNEELIHVKRLHDSSDEASHLFSQALVSTESLLIDPDAKKRFDEKVHDLSGGERKAPERIHTVVLGVAGRHPLTAKSLFTFSQITLARLVENLRTRHVDVRVVSIPDMPNDETE